MELRRKGIIGELNILCDGMGGGGAGEVASSIAVHIIERSILEAYKIAGNTEPKDLNTVLDNAVLQANQVILAYSKQEKEKRKKQGLSTKDFDPGSTLVLQLLDKDGYDNLRIVGDSRAYLLKENGMCSQLCRDQSYIRRLIDSEEDPPEIIDSIFSSFTHPQRNGIYGSLGDANLDKSKINRAKLNRSPGDKLILGCDGLWEDMHPESLGKPVLDHIRQHFLPDLRNANKNNRSGIINQIYGQLFLLGLRQQGVNLLSGQSSSTLVDQILKNPNRGKISMDNVSVIISQMLAPLSETAKPGPEGNKTNIVKTGDEKWISKGNQIYRAIVVQVDQGLVTLDILSPNGTTLERETRDLKGLENFQKGSEIKSEQVSQIKSFQDLFTLMENRGIHGPTISEGYALDDQTIQIIKDIQHAIIGDRMPKEYIEKIGLYGRLPSCIVDLVKKVVAEECEKNRTPDAIRKIRKAIQELIK